MKIRVSDKELISMIMKKIADNPTRSKSMMPGEVTDRYYPQHYYGDKEDGRYMVAPWSGNQYLGNDPGEEQNLDPPIGGLDLVDSKNWPSSDPLKVKFNDYEKYDQPSLHRQMDPYKQDEHMVPAYRDFFNRQIINRDYPDSTYADSASPTNVVYKDIKIPRDLTTGHPNDTREQRGDKNYASHEHMSKKINKRIKNIREIINK